MRFIHVVVSEPGQPPIVASESRASLLLGVFGGLMALATVFIFLRFYTRYVVLNRLGYDDWLALLALVRNVSRLLFSAVFLIRCAYPMTECWLTYVP